MSVDTMGMDTATVGLVTTTAPAVGVQTTAAVGVQTNAAAGASTNAATTKSSTTPAAGASVSDTPCKQLLTASDCQDYHDQHPDG